MPDTWTPIISWFDNRDPSKAIVGTAYWSETALTNPNGRLKIVEGFNVSVPEQIDALTKEAEKQAVERDLWLGAELHARSRNMGIPELPWYIRVPREEWSKPPVYLRNPDRPADAEGLRAYLDSLPKGEGLMFLGDIITYKTE